METAKLIESPIFYDNRGGFAPLQLNVFDKTWLQSNLSINTKSLTLRGLHYQRGESAQAKFIKVIRGVILDFVIDLRPESSEFGRISFFYMKAGKELFVPRNFAHGFITLEDDTIVQYLVDNVYDQSSERTIHWKTIPMIENEIKKYIPKFLPRNVTISKKDEVHNP